MKTPTIQYQTLCDIDEELYELLRAAVPGLSDGEFIDFFCAATSGINAALKQYGVRTVMPNEGN